MITTRVFSENLKAYNEGYRIIANRGGSRSSKTFSIEQLNFQIMLKSKKERIITTVSHTLGHLETGAIRDFETILKGEGIDPESVRLKNPYRYFIGKSLWEFIGFDKPGKALGAARDILHINEPNLMPFSICHQLMQRTRETVFLDWNPAIDFWFDEEEFEKRDDCKLIHSTFLDNFNPETDKLNLTPGQLHEFEIARAKAMDEDRRGKRGYWWNWWQVYGLGLKGQLEGVIFQDWFEYDELPKDREFVTLYGIDWGGNDPTTLTEVNFDGDNREMYCREIIYQPQILNSLLIKTIHHENEGNHIVVCDSARKDKIFELQMAGINAHGATKGEGSIIDGIDRMHEFTIFIHRNSENIKREFNTYMWAKDKITGKPLNEPEDKNNHSVDGIRYTTRFYRKNIRPL